MGFISKIREKFTIQSAPLIDNIRGKYVFLRKKAKQYYHIAKGKVIWVKEKAFSEEYNNYFAAVSFFPFIGWLIPLYLKPENEFCQKQSRRGFYLALIFLALLALLLFVGIFFSRDWRLVRFIHAIFIYLVEFIYFGFCVYGARLSVLNKEAEIIDKFPFIAQLATMIEL